mgnify:CR=1 FL=1
MLVEEGQHSRSACYRLDIDPLVVRKEVGPAETDLVLNIKNRRGHHTAVLLGIDGLAAHVEKSDDQSCNEKPSNRSHLHGFSLPRFQCGGELLSIPIHLLDGSEEEPADDGHESEEREHPPNDKCRVGRCDRRRQHPVCVVHPRDGAEAEERDGDEEHLARRTNHHAISFSSVMMMLGA